MEYAGWWPENRETAEGASETELEKRGRGTQALNMHAG